MSNWLTSFWRPWSGHPYRLARTINTGRGQPVILLHGIGRSGEVWHHLVDILAGQPFQLIAYDLLGFGASPKPEDLDYSVDDQAQALIASLERLHLHEPAVMVGHSLGALIAVRLARLRPDLVKHLVLYEMPLYEGLPEKRRYRARLNVYFKFYEWAIKQNPTFDPVSAPFRERVAKRLMDMELTAETWGPLIKTLRNAIMRQTAADDLKHLKMPCDVIYGTRDMFVIRGKVQEIFGNDTTAVAAHTIRERHMITLKGSRFLAKRIVASMTAAKG